MSLSLRENILVFIGKLLFSTYKKIPRYLFELEMLRKKGVKFSKVKQYVKTNVLVNNKIFDIFLRKKSSDFAVFNQVLIAQEYRPIIEVIKDNKEINQIHNIVDLGANIGLTALYFRAYFENSEILSVEPDFYNYEMLLKNTTGLGIKHLCGGIWNKDTERLKLKSDFGDKRNWSYYLEENDTGNIKGYKISTILSVFNIKQIDLLKIDIEGNERYLFATDEDYSFLKDVRYLCIELHDFRLKKKVYEILDTFNFLCFEANETLFAFKKNIH